ncbi:MAG: ABC transporter permease [Nitrospinaceae bacterium]|jgi:ABC-type dipeptide/oligopeptide/nickel transport system permease subunit|nr:ABC transporter permease [Nitrospinaceae bacterium]
MDENNVSEHKHKPPWLVILKRLFTNKMGVIGTILILCLILVAIFGPLLEPYSYKEQNIEIMNQPPSSGHLLGTDDFGRDVLSRIIRGARISFVVGVLSVAISVLIGVVIGSIAGFYGGVIDLILTTIADLTWSMPAILIALLFVAIIGAGLESVVLAIGLSYWAQYARLIRGQILSLKSAVFIEATKSMGASDFVILFKHLLPNSISPVIVAATIGIGNAIVLEATLGFLGMGAQPPSPSWGAMMSNGTAYLFISPWMIIFPGLAMMITVLGFNLFGDSLIDIMDVKNKEYL